MKRAKRLSSRELGRISVIHGKRFSVVYYRINERGHWYNVDTGERINKRMVGRGSAKTSLKNAPWKMNQDGEILVYIELEVNK